MKNVWKKSLVVLALLSTTANADKGDTYIGVQSNGFSAKYDLNDKITAQALLGFWGDVSSYTGKLNYKFKKGDHYDLYGYGEAGMLVWSGDHYSSSESVPTFGGGAGGELDLRRFDPDFIPLFVNLEVGVSAASFDNYAYSSFGWGLGIHYKLDF